MQFYSLAFVLFMVVALVAYYGIGRLFGKGQWVVLLAASLAFYAFCGWQNFVFVGVTSVSTWIGALAFAHFDGQSKEARSQAESRDEKKAIKRRFVRKKRLVLLAMLVLNFGILSYIKYADVLVRYVMPDTTWTAGILLPLGISFYTFQSISYVVDTYNGKYAPERNFAKYLLFISFFPQVIQGPINRFDALAEQLYATRSFDVRNARRALLQIGYGALKKYVIADIVVWVVDGIFDNVGPGIPGSAVVVGILLYAIYQYADFSGGIDMVLGFARLFGVQMADNFRQPYFSVSLADFWRRWHITLGAWMRDYVFYPFALLPAVQRWGKWLTRRCGKHIGRTLPACVANILVFFLVGLWHGAESHFILWGLYNGLVIAASDLLTPLWDKMNKALHVNVEGKAHHVFCIVRTFIIVNIGWYFDRIVDPNALSICFRNTVFNFHPELLMPALGRVVDSHLAMGLMLAAIGTVFVFIISVLKERGIDVAGAIVDWPAPARGLLYAVVVLMVASSFMFGMGSGFMYANF
ncbi:MAG: MBOAT family protein [Eggerthellaceae bacterium]|nr:MBOAT family protein [Eggerthellaceae bacterium]